MSNNYTWRDLSRHFLFSTTNTDIVQDTVSSLLFVCHEKFCKNSLFKLRSLKFSFSTHFNEFLRSQTFAIGRINSKFRRLVQVLRRCLPNKAILIPTLSCGASSSFGFGFRNRGESKANKICKYLQKSGDNRPRSCVP